MLVYERLEIGRAAEILLDYYVADRQFSGDRARVKADHGEAVRLVASLGIDLWQSVPAHQRDPLLRAASYERLHGKAQWDEIGDVGPHLVARFRSMREIRQRELAESPQLGLFYGALWDLALKWALDYPWIVTGLTVRALQEDGFLPEELPDEAADVILPDLGLSMEMPLFRWWEAGKGKHELDGKWKKALTEWEKDLRARGFVEPYRAKEQHMLWVYHYDARGKSALQIWGNTVLNPKERKVRAIQEAIKQWHHRLGKLSTRRRLADGRR